MSCSACPQEATVYLLPTVWKLAMSAPRRRSHGHFPVRSQIPKNAHFSNISNFRPSIPPIFLIRHQSQESQCQTRVTKIKTKVFVWLTTLDIYKKYLICCIYQICVCRHLLLEMYFSIILTDFTHYTRNQDSCLTNFDLFSLTYFFIMYLFIWKPKTCKLVRNNLSIHVTFYKFCKRNR